MSTPKILVTGFEPFGSMHANPSLAAMRAVDGLTIAGFEVVGHGLPVSLARLAPEIERLVATVKPSAILSLGLAPGEALIRVERVALNLADFLLPDNDGAVVRDGTLEIEGGPALFATLPVRSIVMALNQAGVPATISNSAGTYLCNACLYRFLRAAALIPARPPTGFLHLPHTPEEVADLLLRQDIERRADLAGAASPSMDLDRMVKGIRIAITETARVITS